MTVRAFTMPKWGIEMREGTVAEWGVAEGAAFAKGDLIALIETDKITNEFEAEFPAVLRRILVPAGETRAVGALLGVFADEDDDEAEVDALVDRFRAADTSTAADAKAAPTPAASTQPAQSPTPAKAVVPAGLSISPEARRLAETGDLDVTGIAGSGRGGRITFQDLVQAERPAAHPALRGQAPLGAETAYASPLARRIALQNGIDLSEVVGTGPRGRICKADVLERIRPAVAHGVEILPMSNLRKAVARRLTQAKTTIPHFYLRAEVAVDALQALRSTANLVVGRKASLNDYLVRAVALALIETPEVNIQVHGDVIHRFASADVAVAVATDRGLVTPIVRGADRLSVHDIGEAVRALAAKAHAGRLGQDDIEGGSFTVSNLGMFGIDGFDAIINPPQAAILAVGATRRVFAEQAGGSGAFETGIALSLSCDHRAIDGATGAKFMAALKGMIEQPTRLFGG